MESLRTIARFRPLTNREVDNTVGEFCVERDGEHAVGIGIPSYDDDDAEPMKKFAFDHLFLGDSTQEQIYEEAARATVEDVVNGFNGTIFAYGQTGAGKSWTMFGSPSGSTEDQGIIPRATRDVLEMIHNDADPCCGSVWEWQLACSFLELYNEKINDLLAPSARDLKIGVSSVKGRKSTVIRGLTEDYIKSVNDVWRVLHLADATRARGETLMNKDSSRSHSVFMLKLRKVRVGKGEVLSESRLCLVDLAGSERLAKTGATGTSAHEAKHINQSLTTLGRCICAIAESRKQRDDYEARKSHVLERKPRAKIAPFKEAAIPFRESLLTRILEDSLTGNTKTTICACVSPAVDCFDETMSTLMFARRAKQIRTAPIAAKETTLTREDLEAVVAPLQAKIAQLEPENAALRSKLQELATSERNHEPALMDPISPIHPVTPARRAAATPARDGQGRQLAPGELIAEVLDEVLEAFNEDDHVRFPEAGEKQLQEETRERHKTVIGALGRKIDEKEAIVQEKEIENAELVEVVAQMKMEIVEHIAEKAKLTAELNESRITASMACDDLQLAQQKCLSQRSKIREQEGQIKDQKLQDACEEERLNMAEGHLSQLGSEVQLIKGRLAESLEAGAQLSVQLDNEVAKGVETRSKARAARHELKATKQRLHEARDAQASLEAELSAAREETAIALEKESAARSIQEQQRMELADLTAQLQSAQASLSDTQTMLDESVLRLRSTEEELLESQNLLEETGTHLEETQRNLLQSQKLLSNAGSRLKAQESVEPPPSATITESSTIPEELKQEVAALKEQIRAAESALERSGARLVTVEDQLDQSRHQCKLFSNHIKAMEGNDDKATKYKAALERVVAERQEAEDEFENQRAMWEEEKEWLQEVVDGRDSDRAAVEKARIELENERGDLARKLEALEEEQEKNEESSVLTAVLWAVRNELVAGGIIQQGEYEDGSMMQGLPGLIKTLCTEKNTNKQRSPRLLRETNGKENSPHSPMGPSPEDYGIPRPHAPTPVAFSSPKKTPDWVLRRRGSLDRSKDAPPNRPEYSFLTY